MRDWKSDVKAACVIVAFYLILEMVLGITCPFKFLTGISDAGCGMSRAWLCVLHFDFKGAFYYHPLWILPVPAAAAMLFKDRMPEKIYRMFMGMVVAAFLIIYAYRMIFMPDQDIVVFRPREGFIWRSVRAVCVFIKANI
ncbi:DUF2752 domain-containing protein [Oribacterium sp. WCC10]|uniref:DUF2752 domain-containing protein n=1 Tax=Oribacterium sp. WCC10 TaxID=1855343 RepID=UPI0008F167FE|nr:DUF2752 domain-containing protein [Oribacterium sp. WCC10]SFG15099.1 Protein of unknown function [Oribacterium sp. WCC10]